MLNTSFIVFLLKQLSYSILSFQILLNYLPLDVSQWKEILEKQRYLLLRFKKYVIWKTNACILLFLSLELIFLQLVHMHISLQFRISALEYNVINNSLNLGDTRYCKSGYFHWWCIPFSSVKQYAWVLNTWMHNLPPYKSFNIFYITRGCVLCNVK